MIKKQEVQHIAKLARLGITKKEEERFQKELSSILDYFESLKEVDVSEIEPTFHPTEHFFKRKLEIMREDKAELLAIEKTNKLIETAPEKKKGYIKVKPVL